MRKSFGVLAAGFCALSIAGSASAASLGFTGSLTIRFDRDIRNFIDTGPLTMVIPGSGTAGVNGSGVAGHLTALGLAGGQFATSSLVVPQTDPGAVPIAGVQITVTNGPAAFAGAGGGAFGGVMPLHGVMKLCLFGPCSAAGVNVDIPLSVVGKGGFVAATGAVTLTAVGAPWTTGTAVIGTHTVMGGVSPFSNTGAPGGNVNLVTPIFISTNMGGSPVWPAFGILSLYFTAECSDGVDNDGDGLIDFPADPGCKSAESGNERRQCQDGLDNDGDGNFDFDGGASANHGVALGPLDPQCTQPWRNTERPNACGLGAELVLGMPLLSLVAKRRRRASI